MNHPHAAGDGLFQWFKRPVIENVPSAAVAVRPVEGEILTLCPSLLCLSPSVSEEGLKQRLGGLGGCRSG